MQRDRRVWRIGLTQDPTHFLELTFFATQNHPPPLFLLFLLCVFTFYTRQSGSALSEGAAPDVLLRNTKRLHSLFFAPPRARSSFVRASLPLFPLFLPWFAFRLVLESEMNWQTLSAVRDTGLRWMKRQKYHQPKSLSKHIPSTMDCTVYSCLAKRGFLQDLLVRAKKIWQKLAIFLG